MNALVNAPFDALFWPVRSLPQDWQIVILALPAALLALTVYKFFSNQCAIRAAKAKIIAHLLELRLFRDDLRVLLGAQARVFFNIGRYLGHSALPMLLMLPIFVLMVIQIESRFAFRGLAQDEEALIGVSVASDRPVSRLPIRLDVDGGLQIVTPALRADAQGEIYWRVHAVAAGTHALNLLVDGERVQRFVKADASSGAMTASYRANDVRSLLYPHETALPSEGPITSVFVDYPRARGEMAGLSTASWLFAAIVLLYAFALRRLFGVSF